ncbi:parallel beta-helix repeat protein [Nitrobacter vulgaris]|uniref:right-handed parallel beta-helix repeat-containing protein n=1 Tax=Nitrobacter vulgaris TaxID=29421 RepID=UPI00285FD662|nr:right-handed parallel beta-helix repeat-containing protein [Nitrobacter vulgaris]MDR6305896.1 parallel beta-helix repeat protein [Nitrobacter vulgaris]
MDGPFNLVWYNATDFPDPSDDPYVEIVRCTARSTDVLTVERAQEGTSASIKDLAGKTYKMLLAATQKTVGDIADRANHTGEQPIATVTGLQAALDAKADTVDVPTSFDDLGDGATNKAYTGTEKAKLAGIEASADVTDAANVAAAGAFMKSVDDADDVIEGSSHFFLTAAERTKLSNTSGANTGDQTSVTGNAGTATALQTARTIDGQAFDGSANITVIAPGTHAATGKTTPADSDELPIVDSAESNVLKKLTWANLKAALKTYFDAVYQTVFGYKTCITVGFANADYICDGSEDDVQLQAAIDAVAAAGGGTIFVKRGTYAIAAQVFISSNVAIIGDGYGTLLNLASGSAIKVDGESNVRIERIRTNGSAQVTNDSSVHVLDSSDVRIEGCDILDANGFGIFINATGTNTTERVWVVNNRITGRGNSDVIGGGPNNSTGAAVKDVHVHGNHVTQDVTISGIYPSAFDIVAVSGVDVQGNTFVGEVTFGFEQSSNITSSISNNIVYPALGNEAGGIFVTSNTSQTSPDFGLNFVGNVLYSSSFTLSASGSTKKIGAFAITGNTILPWSTQHGIYLVNTSNGTVTGNTIASNSPIAPFDTGIYLLTSDNILIEGNQVSRAAYGIYDASSEPTILIGINSFTAIVTEEVTGGTRYDANFIKGPIFATDNAIARYDGTTGKLVQASGVYVSDTGRLGIGTASPLELLSLWSDNNGQNVGADQVYNAIIFQNSADNYRVGEIKSVKPTGVYGDEGALAFFTKGAVSTERLRIGHDGNIGIGTSAPKSKLHVEGTSGWIIADEQDADPTTAELDANDSVAFYSKANKLVFAYNNAGTMTYLSLPLDGSSTAWTHSTVAP